MSKHNLLTTAQVSVIVGMSHDYIRRLILIGKLKAEKVGSFWLIDRKEIKNIKRQRFARKNENGSPGKD